MLKIHELSAASPDMTDDEMVQLEDDIKKFGQLEPIWIYRDEIIDGRKRAAVCRKLGLEPKVKVLDVISPGVTLPDYAWSLNVLRTHYTAAQRAMYATRCAMLRQGDVKTQLNQAETAVRQIGIPLSIAQVAAKAGVKSKVIDRANMSVVTPCKRRRENPSVKRPG